MVRGLGMQDARYAILATLHAHGGAATSQQVIEATGMSPALVSYHLRAMEAHQLVTADVEDGKRRGVTVTWTTNYAVLQSEWAQMARRILGTANLDADATPPQGKIAPETD